MQLVDLRLVDQILLGVLLVLAPVNGVVQLALARKTPDLERIPVYVSSAVFIVVLGTASLVVGVTGAGSASLGLVSLGPFAMVAWTAAITAAVLGVMALFRWVARAAGLRDSALLARLLPRGRRERACFAGLSFIAGTGEEIAYRGYAMSALGAMSVGPWVAAAMTSAAFGLLHSYQGVRGIVTTGVAGFAFAASFVLTGSIWPAIGAHITIDLVAGLVLGEKLLTHGDGGTDACA